VETTTSLAQIVEPDRDIIEQAWSPMATFAEVTLLHPSHRVERIGFHESNHDGARQLEVASTAVNPMVLESRDRGTGSRTAADVVVEPDTEVRSPVTGTVIRAGGYILYCQHNDDFAVIEPDSRPGWEVKVLHISGVQVEPGDRVEAGVTVLAPAATPLPFDSQVDEFTAEPSWPHVHIEVVDPSIPDRPSPGGGC
jgi:biotin carboxyl carrier protein